MRLCVDGRGLRRTKDWFHSRSPRSTLQNRRVAVSILLSLGVKEALGWFRLPMQIEQTVMFEASTKSDRNYEEVKTTIQQKVFLFRIWS